MKNPEGGLPPIIYLIGFMGAGKSTVGRRLAERLGWSFLDLDEEIEKREGMSIAAIFRELGEGCFRSIEARELERANSAGDSVIALGGGAFCSTRNQEIVARTGISVWLDVSIETVWKRCAGEGSRPLFGSREEMAKLLEHRRPFYLKASIRVDAAASVDTVVDEILDFLGFRG